MKKLTLILIFACGTSLFAPAVFAEGFLSSWFSRIFVPQPEAVPAKTEVLQPDQAIPPAEAVASSHCQEFKPYLDESKAEMEKKNSLEANACQLYKSWAKLWQENHCDAASYADAEALVCPGQVAGILERRKVDADIFKVKIRTCDEVQQDYDTDMNWIQASFQACDYSMFDSACGKLADSANECVSRKCPGKCTFSFDNCSPDGFKSLIRAIPDYANNTPRLDQCMDQLRRSGL